MKLCELDKKSLEFYYKRNLYYLPIDSELHLSGNRLFLIRNGKKSTSILKYKSEQILPSTQVQICLPITGHCKLIYNEYQPIADFFNKNTTLNFPYFEYATSNELNLCVFFKPMDFIRDGSLLQDISNHLPALLNIFRRPVIHLKEEEIIQPIDAIKRINHNTIKHLSRNAKNWKSVDYENDRIVPSRLLTKVYSDDYSIYENVVFRDLIDRICSYLRLKIYQLSEVLDTFKESIQVDNINMVNHQKYYLAIGKLYVGFYKNENSTETTSLLEDMKSVYKRINGEKKRAVYTKNSNYKPITTSLKRTNILSMHKDYKSVFYLFEKIRKQSFEINDTGTKAVQIDAQDRYSIFCAMLIMFSASNFNFECISKDNIYYNNEVYAQFSYKKWSFILSQTPTTILPFPLLSLKMSTTEGEASFYFIPMSYFIGQDKRRIYENIIVRLKEEGYNADKYVFLEPFDFIEDSLYNYSWKVSNIEDCFYAILPISIYDINSFRRIQKILLEAMVLSDNRFDTCPFCGDKMKLSEGSGHLCSKCRTVIKIVNCKHCQKQFRASFFLLKQKRQKRAKEQSYEDLPEFYRQEKLYLFRSTVTIAKGYICPHCNGENPLKEDK